MNGQREKVNFVVYYEIDAEEVNTVLRAAEHGGDEDGSWMLLEQVEPVVAEPTAVLVDQVLRATEVAAVADQDLTNCHQVPQKPMHQAKHQAVQVTQDINRV